MTGSRTTSNERRTAQGRGRFAAAAALLELSASLTSQPRRRVERRLAAAQYTLRTGSFDAALGTLAVAESEASVTDELARARVELLRGLVASATPTRAAIVGATGAGGRRLSV